MVTWEIVNDESGRYNPVALERVANSVLIEVIEEWLKVDQELEHKYRWASAYCIK